MTPTLVADAYEMRAFGEAFAQVLAPGDLVILRGPLGAGKTTFAQGVGVGLGVTDAITSPTFVIARVYESGRVPLVHVDAYRLTGIDELEDAGIDDDLSRAVTLVEWGSGVVEDWSDRPILVDITIDDATQMRRVRVVRT